MGSTGKVPVHFAIGCLFAMLNSISLKAHTGDFVREMSDEIYVRPNDSATALCLGRDPCHTLNWYATNRKSALIHSDTRMLFIDGKHSLKTVLNVSNLYNLSMYGKQELITISCSTLNATGVWFSKCRNVEIKGLTFEGCGTRLGAALSFQQGINITLTCVTVKFAVGYGLTISNVFGVISVDECSFSNTTNINAQMHNYSAHARIYFGNVCSKNLQFNSLSNISHIHANVTIHSSQFIDGQNVSGLEIFVYCPNVSIAIDNITLNNNSAGNLILTVAYLGGDHIIFKVMNSYIREGQAESGGGIYLKSHGDEVDNLCINCTTVILEVHNTELTSNYAYTSGGAAYITQFQGERYNEIVKRIVFKNCTFSNNRGNGAVMEITKHQIIVDHSSPALNVTFENCLFLNNSIINSDSLGTVTNIRMSHIIMSGCNFTNNNGTAVSLRRSNLNFHNSTWFTNNRAVYGGALRVCEGSLIFLHNHSKVHFISNSALVGGAVYAEQQCLDTAPPCIFQPALPNNVSIEDFSSLLALTFVDNSAKAAGDSIYGGALDRCYTMNHYSYSNSDRLHTYFNYTLIFNEIFNMTGQRGPSWISSNPRGLCFCENNISDTKIPQKHHCCTNHSTAEVYPGAWFSISAVIVGQFNGITIGTIVTNMSGSGYLAVSPYNEQTKQSQGCVNLTYSILCSKNETASNFTLQLSVKTGILTVNTNLKPFSINYSVSLLPCPLGFQLVLPNTEDHYYKCDCGYPFQQFSQQIYRDIECNITNQVISIRSSQTPVWVGCLKRSNDSVCEQLAASSDCDINYCSNIDYNFSLTSNSTDDGMCLTNREGVLCGACKRGYSRILGSLQICRKCSNRSLLFLIPWFLLSGILLVLFLAVVNITVTEGTINGPIFYGTVLHANLRILPDEHHKYLMKPFRVFVTWLNLHWAFGICAYNGMDGYQHIWLQFGHAFYLILIQGLIIFLSRRFIFFTRLFGKNVLKVLATVLFLLHSQLLHACLSTFQPATLHVSTHHDKNSIDKRVWHYDGNLPYFGLKHAILFFVALLCMLAITFFMLSLFLTQCLNRWTDRRFLRWYLRLRPFYEAFTGPCHNNYRFWPGFLYIMRTGLCCLTINISVNQSHYRQLRMVATSFACILVMLLACIFPHGVYKKWPLNVLEFSFLLNLCITSAFLAKSSHYLVIFYSVPLAMLTCIGILLYHIYQQCRSTCVWKKLSKYAHERINKQKRFSSKSNEENEKEPFLPQPLPPVVHFKDFREPLLED